MSKLLVDVHHPDLHPSSPLPVLPDPARLRLVDRISLRLGLWLLLRSAASAQRFADPDERARLVKNRQALELRERAVRRHTLLTRPPL